MSRVFLDTNVLVSSIDTTRANHKRAINLIEKIREEEFQGFISTQIIGEFYVSLTRSFGGIKAPLSPDEARKEIEEMLSSRIFIVLPVTEAALRKKALNLCAEKGIKGVKFWDVVIVATMLENEISVLYTENTEDFKKFKDLVIVRSLSE